MEVRALLEQKMKRGTEEYEIEDELDDEDDDELQFDRYARAEINYPKGHGKAQIAIGTGLVGWAIFGGFAEQLRGLDYYLVFVAGFLLLIVGGLYIRYGADAARQFTERRDGRITKIGNRVIGAGIVAGVAIAYLLRLLMPS